MTEDLLRGILLKLEESVDKIKLTEITDAERAELEKLAKSHFTLQQQITELQAQLDATQDKQFAVDNKIYDAVNKISGKSIKLGRILIKIKNTRTLIKGKVTFSYKNILRDLRAAIEIEARIINPIINKWRKPAVNSVKKDSDLIITKESIERLEKVTGKKIQLIESPFMGGFVQNVGNSILAMFKGLFAAFSEKIDQIDNALGDVIL